MPELLSNDEFMNWALGVSVWLMLVVMAWKSTSHNPALGWLQLRRRSLLEMLNPFFWLLLAVGLPVMLPVLLLRAAARHPAARHSDAWACKGLSSR